MSVNVNGTSGVSAVQDGVVQQSDLAAGVASNGPCFSAYATADQTVTTGVDVKVQLPFEEFDVTSAFDSTTNYRFQPTVAGYYQVNAKVHCRAATSLTYGAVKLRKNSISEPIYNFAAAPYSTNFSVPVLNIIVYMNGTTDYIELYGVAAGTGTCSFYNTSTPALFQAVLVRAA